MRPCQSTLRAEAVHARARRLLAEHLRLRDHKRCVPAGRLAGLLLLAAGGRAAARWDRRLGRGDLLRHCALLPR